MVMQKTFLPYSIYVASPRCRCLCESFVKCFLIICRLMNICKQSGWSRFKFNMRYTCTYIVGFLFMSVWGGRTYNLKNEQHSMVNGRIKPKKYFILIVACVSLIFMHCDDNNDDIFIMFIIVEKKHFGKLNEIGLNWFSESTVNKQPNQIFFIILLFSKAHAFWLWWNQKSNAGVYLIEAK